MKKEYRVSLIRPNVPDGLVLLVQARSLRKAVKKLRYSAEFQLPSGYYIVRETGNADNSTAVSLMPAFVEHFHISREEADIVNGYLQAKTQDEFQSEDETISHTILFPDGKQMDVKCCGARDERSWTEAVLFDERGCELCCSEPFDRYSGLWELEYQGRRYVTFVHIYK